jgi:hypothetical protein
MTFAYRNNREGNGRFLWDGEEGWLKKTLRWEINKIKGNPCDGCIGGTRVDQDLAGGNIVKKVYVQMHIICRIYRQYKSNKW